MLRMISKAPSAAESVRLRNLYRLLRIFVLIGFTFLMVVEIVFFVEYSIPNISSGVTIWRYSIDIIAMVGMTYACMSLPISGYTIDRLDNRKEFILYLRGFSCDCYDPILMDRMQSVMAAKNFVRTDKKDVNKQPFSERDFNKALKNLKPKMAVYSVGMTKELESPEGIKRIYLDDETWQRDVLILIERASYVFVLANPRESCIWEILKCQEKALDKTIFFVDNEKVPELLQEKLPYCPDWLKNYIPRHSVIYRVNGKYIVDAYENDNRGFFEALKNVFYGIEGSKNKVSSRRSFLLIRTDNIDDEYKNKRKKEKRNILLIIILIPLIWGLFMLLVSFVRLMMNV